MTEHDQSVLVAMLADESMRMMSTASYVETAIVIGSRFDESGGRELDLWLLRASVDLVAVDADQTEAARAACRRYGKGRHRAGLGYGDCFSVALAEVSGEPLLFTGDGYAQTDIVAAQ
ncbi:type II toxin-antitoxin system VapC family toxin [Mycobacterium sp. NPDC049093]